MCGPAAIAVAAVVAVGAITAANKQSAANDAAEYNAQIAERNAHVAELSAQQAELRGSEREKLLRRKTAQLKGTQRAAFGGSGVLVDEGSALDTILDTTEFGELDALNAQYNAQTEAWGLRQKGVGFKSQATLSRASKRSPEAAGFGSLLSNSSLLLAAK